MKHEFDVPPQTYARLVEGTLTFLIREIDDGLQFGDRITLKEFDPKRLNPTDTAPRGYTGSKALEFTAGFLQIGGGGVIVSLVPVKKAPAKKK